MHTTRRWFDRMDEKRVQERRTVHSLVQQLGLNRASYYAYRNDPAAYPRNPDVVSRIADYLDEAYPDRPRLFGSPAERELCRFVELSLFVSAGRPLLMGYVKDIHDHAHERDRAYFRQSREKLFGCTLEELASGRAERIEAARAGFDSVRLTLKGGAPFLSGAHPGYADYIVGGFLLWIASVATAPLLAGDDPLLEWLGRVQDLHGGLGRKSPLNALAA